MPNNKEVTKPTTQEIETFFSNPERARRDMAAISKSAEIMNNLVINGKATAEIKIDGDGKEYVVVKQGEEVIHLTRDSEEILTFKEYLKNPEQYLRNRQLKGVEEDLTTNVIESLDKINKQGEK